MPTFLLGMTGPHLRIAGAIYLGQVVSGTLVGYNDLVPPLPSTQLDPQCATHHDRYARDTAHTLRVLRNCLDKLEEEYKSMEEKDLLDLPVFNTPTGTLTSTLTSTLPAPHFRQFTSADGVQYTLTYQSHLLGKPLEARSIFLAEANSASTRIKCVVKFAEQYGKDAHVMMAKNNMAAELLFCEWAPSVGLWVVITKFYLCDMSAPLSDAVLGQLEVALETLHSQNLVHGDLRRPNILTDEEGRVRLIDFEWSGEAGVVRYPALLNPEIPWPEGVKPGRSIQPQHDRDSLALYKEQRDAATRVQT